MSGRIQQRFAALKAEGRGGLVTFVTAGDPDPETSERIAGFGGVRRGREQLLDFAASLAAFAEAVFSELSRIGRRPLGSSSIPSCRESTPPTRRR